MKMNQVVPPKYSSDVKFDLSDSSALMILNLFNSNRVYWKCTCLPISNISKRLFICSLEVLR